MQNSNPSFAVRFSWECQCGAWGTARTENQAKRAIEAHKEHRKDGCGECKLTPLVQRMADKPDPREPAAGVQAPNGARS
jgi:hypothetical protein